MSDKASCGSQAQHGCRARWTNRGRLDRDAAFCSSAGWDVKKIHAAPFAVNSVPGCWLSSLRQLLCRPRRGPTMARKARVLRQRAAPIPAHEKARRGPFPGAGTGTPEQTSRFMLYKLGRVLQLLGLLILPVAI